MEYYVYKYFTDLSRLIQTVMWNAFMLKFMVLKIKGPVQL